MESLLSTQGSETSRSDKRHWIAAFTSEQPVVNVHPRVSHTDFSPPELADFYYPISPKVAYTIYDSDRFDRGKYRVDEATVLELNSKQAAQAMIHIIGDTEEALVPYVQRIGTRYRKRARGTEK